MSQKAARATRKSTLRDKLARKRAKTVTVHFPLDEKGERAKEAVVRATLMLETGRRVVVMQGPEAKVDISVLERELAEAEAERDKLCLALTFRGLTEDEQDALASSFPTEDIPEDADQAKITEIVKKNAPSIKEWTYHALEVAVVDSDLTADDWREELSTTNWSAGDLQEIRAGIMRAYGGQPAGGIPEG